MHNLHLTDDQLQGYFDGTGGVTENLLVEKHLLECKVCTKEFEQLKSIHKMIKVAYSVRPLPVNFSDKVADRVSKKKKNLSFTFDNFLLLFLFVASVTGSAYYVSLSFQSSSFVVLVAVAVSFLMYFLSFYSEVRAFHARWKGLL